METTEIHTVILNKMKERGKYESNHFICLRHGYCHIHGGTEKVMEYCKEHGLNVNYSQTTLPLYLEILTA